MAYYEPVRDAFASLNKLIEDQRQWDERRAADNADRKFKQNMLQSELEQRAFNNQMTMNRFDMELRGEDRESSKIAFDQHMANKNYEIRKSEAGMSKEAHEENMARSKMERLNLLLDVREKQSWIANRDETLSQIRQEVFTDPVARATNAYAVASTRYNNLKSTYDSLDPNNNRHTVRRAVVKEKLDKAQAAMDTNTLTPQDKIDMWRAHADSAREMAFNLPGPAEAEAKRLMDVADDYDRRAEAELDNLLQGQKNAAKKAGEDKALTRYQRFATHFGKLDANNQIFVSASAKAKIELAQTISNTAREQLKMTEGQSLVYGMEAVRSLENDLATRLEAINQDIQSGVWSEVEGEQEKQKLIETFKQEYNWDPTNVDSDVQAERITRNR